jgi:DNA polymerase elongation subunit (family B)
MNKKSTYKRLFFDIETSPNLVFSWNVGRKISIDYDNIINERAIICVCWKWEGEDKVYSLNWDKGNDKKLVEKFSQVINSAQEVIGHNSIGFDEKWLRTRCLFHGVSLSPKFNSIDTLKLSRKGFRFNSNRLDYIGKYLGLGKKEDTGGFSLWKAIVMNNSREALAKMIHYCKNDVILLEKIFQALNPYVESKTSKGIALGGTKVDCPECGSKNIQYRGYSVTLGGSRKRRCQCQECGKYYQITEKAE